MKLLLLSFLVCLSLSCSNDNSVNDANNLQKENNNENLQNTYYGTFIGEFKTPNGFIYADSIEGLGCVNLMKGHFIFEDNISVNGHSYITGMVSPMVYLSPISLGSSCGWKSSGFFQAERGFRSSDGSNGKTYTEEFKDLEGNTRTRVYKNGLLVNYKINGVEQ